MNFKSSTIIDWLKKNKDFTFSLRLERMKVNKREKKNGSERKKRERWKILVFVYGVWFMERKKIIRLYNYYFIYLYILFYFKNKVKK